MYSIKFCFIWMHIARICWVTFCMHVFDRMYVLGHILCYLHDVFYHIIIVLFVCLLSCRNNKKRENLEYYFITCIFPNIKLKSGFRISCNVRRKLFEESTATALTPYLLGISTFLGFLKSGGNLNGVTAM